MDSMHLNPLAILAAAAMSFLIGGVWYSPILFARRWQQAAGLSDEQLKGGQARIFGLSFLCALVMAANLAAFLGGKASVGFGLAAGAATGIGWVAMSFAVNDLFERRPLALWLINAGYHGVSLTLMGGLLAWWQ